MSSHPNLIKGRFWLSSMRYRRDPIARNDTDHAADSAVPAKIQRDAVEHENRSNAGTRNNAVLILFRQFIETLFELRPIR